MFLNPIERIKMDKLKFLMIRQRCGRISPFILKKTFELTASASILYCVGTGLVKVLNYIIQFCNKFGTEGLLLVMVNIFIAIMTIVTLIYIILTVISIFRY